LRLITKTAKITTLIQNINPDSDMNAQKNSPKVSNIYFLLLGWQSQ
jgi:hypothetical protein